MANHPKWMASLRTCAFSLLALLLAFPECLPQADVRRVHVRWHGRI